MWARCYLPTWWACSRSGGSRTSSYSSRNTCLYLHLLFLIKSLVKIPVLYLFLFLKCERNIYLPTLYIENTNWAIHLLRDLDSFMSEDRCSHNCSVYDDHYNSNTWIWMSNSALAQEFDEQNPATWKDVDPTKTTVQVGRDNKWPGGGGMLYFVLKEEVLFYVQNFAH